VKKNSIPLVSIIAVCYNHSKYAVECLNSIVSQSYENIELIIIDDCSSDNSVQLIKHWMRKNQVNCKFIAHEKNVGICRTLNEGLEKCCGYYVQLIATDDVLYKNKIKDQVRLLESEKSSGYSYTNFSLINEQGEVLENQHYPENYSPPEDLFREMLKKKSDKKFMAFHPATILARKDAIMEVGGADERFLQEDFYIWLNVSFIYDGKYCPSLGIKYRKLSHSLSGRLGENLHSKVRTFTDQIIVIDGIIEKAKRERLKALISAKLNRLTLLEGCVIRSKAFADDSERQLKDYQQTKIGMKQQYPEFEDIILKSIVESIYNIWINGNCRYFLYESFLREIPLLRRLGIKLIRITWLVKATRRLKGLLCQ